MVVVIVHMMIHGCMHVIICKTHVITFEHHGYVMDTHDSKFSYGPPSWAVHPDIMVSITHLMAQTMTHM